MSTISKKKDMKRLYTCFCCARLYFNPCRPTFNFSKNNVHHTMEE